MKLQAKSDVEQIGKDLGISFITDEEMEKFKRDCDAGRARGQYSPDDFRVEYGELFGF